MTQAEAAARKETRPRPVWTGWGRAGRLTACAVLYILCASTGTIRSFACISAVWERRSKAQNLPVVCFAAYLEPMLSEKVDTELDTIDASCFAALVNDLCCGTLH